MGNENISDILKSKTFEKLFNFRAFYLSNFLETTQGLDEKRSKILADFYKNFDPHTITRTNRIPLISNIGSFGEMLQSVPDSSVDTITSLVQKGCDVDILNKYIMILRCLNGESDVSNMTREVKTEIVSTITKLEPYMQNANIFTNQELTQIENLNSAILKSLSHSITPTKVTSKDIETMARGFFANNNQELEDTIKNADFTKYALSGVPLKYSRKEFLKNLSALYKNTPESQRKTILSKLEIEIKQDKEGNITGYNGIINPEELSNTGIEGGYLKIIDAFIKNNEVVTEDENLNQALNSLIKGMPEFINIIGKKQHETHAYSLDIHILKVFQDSIKNPMYQNLSAKDKTTLKYAAILHDIAKNEGENDPLHPEKSASYANDILSKYPYLKNMKDRIVELIENHHWFAKYHHNMLSYSKIASLFRRQNDFVIAKILTEADIKGVSNDFYKLHKDELDDKKINEEVEKILNQIYQTGQLLYTTPIVNQNLIPAVYYNNRKYRVVDLAKIDENTDLSNLGFEKGLTKNSLRFLIHVSTPKNLEKFLFVQKGFICASFISFHDKSTYHDIGFGLGLDSEQINIANASKKNQSSGKKKDFQDFEKIITCQDEEENNYRITYAKKLMENLNLTQEEYLKLFSLLSQYSSYEELADNLSDFKFISGSLDINEIIRIIKETSDDLLTSAKKHNEVNVYNPKVNAFIAKADNLNQIPQDYLNIIYKYDLPVILLGR